MQLTQPFVKILQLIMAVVSACQVLFMITRAPRVPWEAIYLPLSEAVTYGLSYLNHGYVRLANGKILPWSRMAGWLCTCPIMLGMVSNMALVKYKSQPLNPLMVAASLIRTVFGISATMSSGGSNVWLFFFIALCCFLFEYTVVYAIFGLTIADFASIGSPLANAVVARLKLLRGIFFFSWTAFPIIWLMSSTSTCILNEDVRQSNCFACLYATVQNQHIFDLLLLHMWSHKCRHRLACTWLRMLFARTVTVSSSGRPRGASW